MSNRQPEATIKDLISNIDLSALDDLTPDYSALDGLTLDLNGLDDLLPDFEALDGLILDIDGTETAHEQEANGTKAGTQPDT